MKIDPDLAPYLDTYVFDLPERLIAARPAARREDARLLVVHPDGHLTDTRFSELPAQLRAGDLLLLNDTRVSPRRVYLRRASGARIEALFLERRTPRSSPTATDPDDADWLCLVRGLRKLQPGERLRPERGDEPLEVLYIGPETTAGANARLRPVHAGTDRAAWANATEAAAAFDRLGEIPLPPYIRRAADDADRDRYQTVYARRAESVAAPTAGLHFSPELLERLAERGVERAALELQVGYGTFAPLERRNFAENRLHTERYSISTELAARLNQSTPHAGRRLAVGTTTLRALEANLRRPDQNQSRAYGTYSAGEHETRLFLRPPDTITSVDGLITNFHLPGSSLLLLVACLVGRAALLAAYDHAIRHEYRFFSYGDAMLIWNRRP